MLKIDIHTHIIPERLPDLVARYGYDGFIRLDHHKPCCARMMKGDTFFREIRHDCWDPGKRMSDCDDAGVHVQALSTIPVLFSYWARPADALDLSRLLNDHIAEIVCAHPSRFVGLCTVPMQDPALAVRELERCVRDLGFPGVQIGSHVERDGAPDWNLDEPQVVEVLTAAAELGAAVFVHPWDMMGKADMPRHWLPWLVGMPAETSRAICSVIFGGVLDRLPDLRIGFAHGGGSFPGTIGRIEHGHAVRPDLCATNTKRGPREYLDRFYVDSLVHDADTLRGLIALMGAERIALGSDYPFPLGEHRPGALVESMDDLSESTRARILGGTALEFLGLERSAFAPAEAAGR